MSSLRKYEQKYNIFTGEICRNGKKTVEKYVQNVYIGNLHNKWIWIFICTISLTKNYRRNPHWQNEKLCKKNEIDRFTHICPVI